MRISKKTDYALRAIFTLVENHGGEPIPIGEIAKRNKIPKRFLEHILLDMKGRGWVDSVPGKLGGYLLAKDPKEITMGQIVRLFDGVLAPIACVSISHYESCTQESVCRFRRLMMNVRNTVAGLMDKATLASVFAESIVTRREVLDLSFVGGDGI
ncbi:MAG: Rrf2 family transcriptional regulator [Spirochaetia bacterium]|nr:Rrf2 family transcriptional regulator [Spirochaetia bacterium]